MSCFHMVVCCPIRTFGLLWHVGTPVCTAEDFPSLQSPHSPKSSSAHPAAGLQAQFSPPQTHSTPPSTNIHLQRHADPIAKSPGFQDRATNMHHCLHVVFRKSFVLWVLTVLSASQVVHMTHQQRVCRLSYRLFVFQGIVLIQLSKLCVVQRANQTHRAALCPDRQALLFPQVHRRSRLRGVNEI